VAAINAIGVVAHDAEINGDFKLKKKSRFHAANDAIQSRPLSPDINAVILNNIQQFNGG